MAKQRIVNTRFWDDDYTSNLDPIEKLLFLYFLTNTSTNICGVYEIPLKKVANETGLDKEMVIKIIKRFSKEKKILYQDGWVVIKNFIKHQNTKNPKILKGIQIELENAPEHIRNIAYIYPMDSLSHSNSNLNTNLNTNSKEKVIVKKPLKKSYGELESVKLSDEEHAKLFDFLGENILNMLIFEMDTYIQSSGKNYKSHYAAILNWAKRKGDEANKKKELKKTNVAFL